MQKVSFTLSFHFPSLHLDVWDLPIFVFSIFVGKVKQLLY